MLLNPTLMKSVTTKISTVYRDEYGFIRINLDTSRYSSLGIIEALELCNAICEICDDTPSKFITDARGVGGFVDPAARKVIKDHPGMKQVRVAEAFVVDNLSNRLIAESYMKFDKPSNPTEVFDKIEDAMEWLDTIELSND